MRLLTTLFSPTLLLACLPTPGLEAQSSLKDSLMADSAYTAAVSMWHTYVSPETGLYRGVQYFDYPFKLQQGQPFLGPDMVRVGSVWYGGIEYDNAGMKYNLVKEQLAIVDPSKVYLISLYMDLVDSFRLDGHVFYQVKDKLAPSILRSGYCDKIHEGRFLILKRDRKTLQTNVISLNNPVYAITETIYYYILKNGAYYAVNSKRKLFQALSDRRRSDIKKVIRQSGLDWSTDKERLLQLVADWYDGAR